MEVTGLPIVTISRGRIVWEKGQLHVQPGSGKYISRPSFGPAFDGMDMRDAAADPARFKVDRQPYTGPVIQLQ